MNIDLAIAFNSIRDERIYVVSGIYLNGIISNGSSSDAIGEGYANYRPSND